jgi:CDP-glucose 4,6-dehydratase
MNKFWKDKNVFVTGATGFLGTHIVEELLKNNANVIALVRDNVPRSRFFSEGIHERITKVNGEVENYALLERALNEHEIEAVFHLAAQTIVTTANRSPLSTFETNIRGTYNLLEACRVSPLVKRIVVASSDKAYGTQPKLPYSEDAPLQGEHPYDVSKSCADLLAQSYYKTYGIPVSITRCGNLYGAGDLNFNRIIPGTIRSIINNQQPIIRSDGTYIRDYFYVKDAAEAYILLAENLDRPEIRGQAFNFSTKNKITVLELVNTILKLMNSTVKPAILNVAKSEIKNQYLSSEKAKKLLNWEAKYAIEEGLKETIAWYESVLK